MNKFKAGDVVVFPEYRHLGYAIIICEEKYNKDCYRFDRYCDGHIYYNEWDHSDVLLLKDIYNSPLYQALKEEE